MVRLRQRVARLILRRTPERLSLAHAVSPSAAYAALGAQMAEAFRRGLTDPRPFDPAALAAALAHSQRVAGRAFPMLSEESE